MAMKYDTRSCTVSQNWEWVVTGYTTVTETEVTEQKEVTVIRTWHRYGGEWQSGSLSWESVSGWTLISQDYIKSEPWTPSHWAAEGSTYTTTGVGVGTYKGKKKSGGDPIHGWGASGNSTHNASNSITYDDGTYAGTLYLDSVSGSPSAPSYNGSYIGQTDSTSTSGTAYYSGDIPAKQTAPSSPSNFRVTSQNETSVNLSWDSVSGADTYSVETYIKDTSTLVNQNYGLTSLSKFITGLTVGQSYTFKLWAKNSAGNSAPVYTSAKLGKDRPSNFAWTYPKSSETEVDVYASEWNSFLDKINSFREYKGLPSVTTFTSAVADDYIRAIMINQAINIINTLAPKIPPPNAKNSEDDIYASDFNSLRDSLNSVI
jgi:hypothetical protein